MFCHDGARVNRTHLRAAGSGQNLTMADALQHDPEYTAAEERVNAITHGIGFLLAIAALVILVVTAAHHAGAAAVVGCAIFGASLVILYALSTLYHAFPWPRAKRVFHHLDHCAIFILIAGTYTPFTLAVLPPGWGWSLFGLLWGFAALGICFHLFLAARWPRLATVVYVAMGWLAVIAIRPLAHALPHAAFCWLIGGGVAYTLGALCYSLKKIPHHHGFFHLWVIAGSVCHFFAVLGFLMPA